MFRIVVATASIVAATLAAASPIAAAPQSAAASPSARPHVQRVALTFLSGDRVLEGNVALAPGIPVRITVTNYTREFHTFTAPGLHLSKLILPAQGTAPRRTTFTFTPKTWGSFAWHCAICPSGIHGVRHAMNGTFYVIVDPSALG